jgi:hypothetical protein
MFRKASVFFTLGVGALSLLAGVLAFRFVNSPYWTIQRVEASARNFTPYAVSLMETTVDSTGARIQARRVAAMRSDGSMIEINQSLDKDGGIVYDQRKLTWADRLTVDFMPQLRAKSTRRSPASAFALFYTGMKRVASEQCLATLSGERTRDTMGEVLVNTETVGAWRAVHTRISQPNSPVIDSWYAPELGCALVRQVIGYQNSSQTGALIQGQSEKVIEWALAGEPDSALFAVPADYEEMPPSELAGRQAERRTGSRSCLNPEIQKAADERYFAQRP